MSDLRRLLFANQTRAYEGYPLVISRSVALRYLKQYQIYGNSEQDGTPTPSNPIEVISVGDKVVPAGYQELEYIGFNIRTAIATGVPAQETDRVIFEANINVDQGTGDKYLTYATNTWVDIAGGGTIWYIRFGSESSSSFAIFTGEIGQKNTYEVYKNNFDINGVSRATPSYSAISGDWEIGKVGYNCVSGNYYRYTIKNNTTGEIRFNGIPAKRLSDSVVGMYDTVSQSFFTTTGTDTFTAGPEVPNYVIPVVAQGKNLFDMSISHIGIVLNSDTGEEVSSTYGSVTKITADPSVEYTWTAPVSGTQNTIICSYDSNDAYISTLVNENRYAEIATFTTPSNCAYIKVSEHRDRRSLTILVKGSTIPTSYEPYSAPITTPIYLNAPLRKIGNYADYIDYKKGQIIRNVGYIASYNGETITTPYMSSTGELSTGAEVIYGLATPVTESIVAPALPTLAGSTTYTTDTEVKPSNMKGIF